MAEDAWEQDSRTRVTETFVSRGFRCRPVPTTANARRADLRLTYGDGQYVLEVSSFRTPSETLRARSAPRRGRSLTVATRQYAEGSLENRIDARVYDKADQLRSTPAPPDAFRCLWLEYPFEDWRDFGRIVEARLYGISRLSATRDGRDFTLLFAYFYRRFTFYRTPEVDVVIYSCPGGVRGFVNDQSVNIDRFRHSRLYTVLASCVVDPSAGRVPAGSLVLPRDLDRRNPRARWEHIRDRHSLMTSEATVESCHVSVSVPVHDRE